MIVTCERCATRFVLADERVPAGGAPVQCSQCGHVFIARHEAPVQPAGREVIITCERCATVFTLDAALIPPSGAQVQCTRCQHTFLFGGPPLPGVVPAAPGPLPRRDVMLFGAGPLPDPNSPPAESYRSAQGRMMFGSPLTSAQPPSSGIPAERQPRAPPQPADELERMLARACDAPEDEQLLLVLSDALMERGDARGRLIAFMLEEERGSELMRRVKVNVLIRDHAPNWAPPGAKITAFHRGLPSELEWFGPTDPEHLAWRSARKIHVTQQGPADPSLFELLRPNLRSVSGLKREQVIQLLALPPKGLRALSGRFRGEQLGSLAGALSRFPHLEELSLQTALEGSDERLLPEQVAALAPGVSKLKRLRITLPRISFSELELLKRRFPPALDLKFLVALTEHGTQTALLQLDVNQRALLVPAGSRVRQAELLRLSLSTFLGEQLALVRV